MNYTLTLRLTKYCQADCSYCCSWQENPDNFMSAEDLANSVRFVVNRLWPQMRIKPTSVTVQYIGGDILAMPLSAFKEAVQSVRRTLTTLNIPFVDGVQSNLIASERRVLELMNLFSGRVGTSWDGVTERRTVSGSAREYRRISERSIELLGSSRRSGAVVLLDEQSKNHMESEYAYLQDKGLGLVIRPAFEGGRAAKSLSPEDYSKVMLRLLDRWFMQGTVAIDPLLEMVRSRMASRNFRASPCPGCNRQSDCAAQGINIEPNGDLYLCFETADAEVGHFGNSVTGEFDQASWAKLAFRETAIKNSCGACEYYESCKGGCLVESYQGGDGLYGKTPLCQAYKYLFASIDQRITVHGEQNVAMWLSSFDTSSVAGLKGVA